jgi:hypothetical protein
VPLPCRIGVLLRSDVNLEGIAVELHHHIQQAAAASLAAQLRQQDVLPPPTPPQQLLQAHQPPAQQAAAAAAGAAGDGDAGILIEIEVLRRMVRRIFSTEDAVYRRVLVRSGAGEGSAGACGCIGAGRV